MVLLNIRKPFVAETARFWTKTKKNEKEKFYFGRKQK